jgi:Glycosyl transferase 4-like domain
MEPPSPAQVGVRRPKVLFLACYFPPAQAVSATRAWNIAKYLTRLGWTVTVVTPHPSVWRHHEDPEKVAAELAREGIHRITTGYRWRWLEPEQFKCWNDGVGWVLGGLCRRVGRMLSLDTGIGWVRQAERSCARLTADDVDVILATGNPFASFSLAKRLSQKLGRPYVLDYRDPWTTPFYEKPVRKQIVRLEADLLASASAVTVVAQSLLNNRRSDVHVVTNGFDPEELAHIQPHRFTEFAIVYSGTFHPPKIAVTPIMVALRMLRGSRQGGHVPWRFHYYGGDVQHVLSEAERAGVSERVVVHGRVPRAEALSAVRGAGVAIVISSVLEAVAVHDKAIITGKLFDAIGLGVPTLVIGPAGSDIEAILATAGLGRLVPAVDLDGIVTFLQELLAGNRPPAVRPDSYAWPHLIRSVAAVLERGIQDKADLAGRLSDRLDMSPHAVS